MLNFIILFFVLQLINVILNTVKIIITVKGGRLFTSFFTALTYGFYTIVLVFTANDESMWVKMGITVVSNIIGVYFGLWLVDKVKRDKIWEIKAVVKSEDVGYFQTELIDITHFAQPINAEQSLLNVYSKSQAESRKARLVLNERSVNIIVNESGKL